VVACGGDRHRDQAEPQTLEGAPGENRRDGGEGRRHQAAGQDCAERAEYRASAVDAVAEAAEHLAAGRRRRAV
jgi:hypothetical protein